MFGGKKKQARDEIYRIRREARGRLSAELWAADQEHTAYTDALDALEADMLAASDGGRLAVDPLTQKDRGLLTLVSKHLCPNRPPLGCSTDSYIWSEAETWEDFDEREFASMLASACELAGGGLSEPRTRWGGSYFAVLGQHQWADGLANVSAFARPWDYLTSRAGWVRLAFLGERAFGMYPPQFSSDDPAMRLQYEVTSAAGVLAERFMAMKRSGAWA